MLYLLFRLGGDRYALAAQQLAEVLPALNLKQLPGAAPGVAGLCNYRGRPVPVIDLSALATRLPAPRRWGTRLLMVHYSTATAGAATPRLLGLLAENATELMRLDASAFVDGGVRNEGAPYLGPVASTDLGLVQRVELQALLPVPLREQLFAAAEEALP